MLTVEASAVWLAANAGLSDVKSETLIAAFIQTKKVKPQTRY